MQKVFLKPYINLELFSEFNYNICKKNFIKEGIINIIQNDRSHNTYIDKLLYEGYSVLKIKALLKKYNLGYNLFELREKIDSNFLVEVENYCKISLDYINKLNIIDDIIILKNEFKSVKNYHKPDVYYYLLKRETKLKSDVDKERKIID